VNIEKSEVGIMTLYILPEICNTHLMHPKPFQMNGCLHLIKFKSILLLTDEFAFLKMLLSATTN
jgi:hypothetical protein